MMRVFMTEMKSSDLFRCFDFNNILRIHFVFGKRQVYALPGQRDWLFILLSSGFKLYNFFRRSSQE